MPCRSDYMEPSGKELESIRICKCLIYLYTRINHEVPVWVVNATKNYYGNIGMINEATRMLCEACRSLTPDEIEMHIYDAHNPRAREVAGWWERHQEWDARRVKEESEKRKQEIVKKKALSKLNSEERNVLGY